MTNTVTFPATGHVYTDDSDPTTGLGNGGHRVRFVPALSDVVLAASNMVAANASNLAAIVIQVAIATQQANASALSATSASSSATAAANSATSAAASAVTISALATDMLNNPAVSGTSVSSNTIGSGTKTFTTQTGKSFNPGMKLRGFADSADYMDGICTGYNSGTGVLTMVVSTDALDSTGSGTFTSWTLGVVTSESLAAEAAFFYSLIFND